MIRSTLLLRLLLSCALLLPGCVSLAPHFRQPALPVAASYPEALPAGGNESNAGGSLDWTQVLSDPDLRTTIEQALANNRDLRVAVLRVREARGLRDAGRAALYPGLAANAEGLRTRIPSTLGLEGFPAVISAYEVDTEASWEVDLWGRVRSLDSAALETYLATEAAQRAFKVSLVAQVAQTWLELRELDDRIALARRSIATRQESFRIFSRRYSVGSGSRLEVSQVETLLTQAQSLDVQLEQSRAVTAHALELLVGAPVPNAARTGTFAGAEPIHTLPAGLPADLLTARPDILAAEHRLKAAHANIGAARAAFFPQITLTGTLGTAGPGLDSLFSAGSRTWAFVPSISIPIFSGGRLRANLDVAQVRKDIALAQYEATIQGAFRDVADALAQQKWLRDQVEIQHHALSAQTERSKLAQERYATGASTYLEVLDAQRDLLSAEQALVQAQRGLQSSRVSLFAALGGGSLGSDKAEP